VKHRYDNKRSNDVIFNSQSNLFYS